jgi:hypothetical protein
VRPFSTSAKLLLVTIAVVARCGACSVFYPDFQLGPSFRVKVEDHGRPVEGLRLEIGGTKGSRYRVVKDTDKNGFAVFRDVLPGLYHLSAAHDAGIPDGAELEVKLNGPTNVTVPLKWPSGPPVVVRSLGGTIRRPGYLPGQPQPTLLLDILEGRSGRKLNALQTSERGEFDFEGAAPGAYFLDLKPSGPVGGMGDEITGLIPVVVDPHATHDHLDLDLSASSCGLSYADMNGCRQSDLQTDRLSGQVVDPTGAVIPRAKVILLNAAGTLVEELESDSEGRFASPHPVTDVYDLVVSAAGFTPYRRIVRAKPGNEPGPPPSLIVQLGILGGCSTAGYR